MNDRLKVYKGRDNVAHLVLKLNDEVIDPDVATRAVLRFGPYCVDTDVDTDLITLVDQATRLEMRLGMIPDLQTRDCPYRAYLTVYDAASANGLAWDDFRILVEQWAICGDDLESPCG